MTFKGLGRLSWLVPVAVVTLSTVPASAAQLTLTWVDNSANEVGFSVERKTGSASFAEIGLVAADVTTYADGSLTPGQSYCYRVRARNAAGDSAPTNEACGLAVTFRDVPASYWSWRHVEALAALGVTAGCGAGNYCPDGSITRAEMAIFLLKAKLGAGYVPPAASGDEFDDVPAGHWAAAWIEALVAQEITAGCGAGRLLPREPGDAGPDGRLPAPDQVRPGIPADGRHRHGLRRRVGRPLGGRLDRGARRGGDHDGVRRRTLLPESAVRARRWRSSW